MKDIKTDMDNENIEGYARGFHAEEVRIRHSLLKEVVAQPDVEAVLRQFHQNRRKHFSLSFLVVSTSAAAIAAAFLVIFIQRYLPASSSEKPITVFYASHRLDGVTLGSSSGETVSLDEMQSDTLVGKMGAMIDPKRNEVHLAPNSRVPQQTLTLTTPPKRDYKAVLPDGTQVWLNADSRLSYPSVFGRGERVVNLRGEAYFKVTRDKSHPFVVKTENVETRVFGTEFNVRSYSSHDTHVTLVEGSVGVSTPGGRNSVKIAPGQDASLEPNGRFEVEYVDLSTYTEWKNGYFYFDDRSLVDVMCDLGRWYDVDVVFASKAAMNMKVHFVANRNGTLLEAISLFNSLDKAAASFVDNKILIR